MRLLAAAWLALALAVVPARAAGNFVANGSTAANVDAINIADSASYDLLTEFSLSYWTRSTVSDFQVVIARSLDNPNRNYLAFHFPNGTSSGAIRASEGSSGGVSSASHVMNVGSLLNDSLWHHVFVSFESGVAATAWLDCDAASAASGTFAAADDPAMFPTLGAQVLTTTTNFLPASDHRGQTDDTRIYNIAYSQDVACEIFHQRGLDGIVDGLVGRWTMLEGAPGSSITGASGVRNYAHGGTHGTGRGSTLPTYTESVLNGVR